MQYLIPVSNFVNGVNVSNLQLEIEKAYPGLISIMVDAGNVIIEHSSSVLDTATIVAIHNSQEPPDVHHYSSVGIIQMETIVSQTTEWQSMGGVVGDFSFFTDDLSPTRGRITGNYRAMGDNVKMQLCSETGNPNDPAIYTDPNFFLPPTNAVWAPFYIDTIVEFTPGFKTYKFQCVRNGATSFSLRFVTLTLFDIYL